MLNKESAERSVTRRDILRLIPALVVVTLVTGCYEDEPYRRLAPEQEEIFKRRGLYGQRPLVDLRTMPGFTMSGTISGSFLSFSGGAEGGSRSNVQFAWRTGEEKPRIVISELPITKAVFVPSQETGIATVLFKFSDPKAWVHKVYSGLFIKGPYTFDSDNPNDFLQGVIQDYGPIKTSEKMTLATFTLPESEFKNILSPR